MRLTIERMRTLVLAAGILLGAALALFLAVGKWKHRFNRHDIPARLGIDIQQEANGVTYTQSHGGHTLFKIHASKVVQLKQGNALLHDVRIELYGADGSRVDRIEGEEFEYDQESGTAKAAGPVEITLMRPGVAPAIAPKATAGQARGGKTVPLASTLAATAAGEIHVKTSGLTFDQNSQVAATAARVEFEMAQGAGSATGAIFDSQQGTLVLDRDVELNTHRAGESVALRAAYAEFERDARVCRLRAATATYRGGEATAGQAKIEFRDDGSAERLEASDGFTLATANGGHMGAPGGEMEFDTRNRPQRGRLTGGVKMDAKSRSTRGERILQGTAPTVQVDFTPQGGLRHARLERGVAFDSEEQSSGGPELLKVSRHWRSPVADVDFRDAGHGQMEPAAMRGTEGVVVTSESQRGGGRGSPSRLAADQVTGDFAPGSVLTGLVGEGHASIEQTAASGARQTTTGDRLKASLTAPAGEKPGARRTKGSDSAVQSAVVEGHVVLLQVPGQRAEGKADGAAAVPLRATAGRADYEGAGEWLHLTIGPRVEDGGLELTADKIDVSEAAGDAFAKGNVKASWTGSKGTGTSSAGASGGPQSVALGGQGPAHVIAGEAQLHQASGEATFRGQARLWQQANSISAPVIVLDRIRQTLVARATDEGNPVRVVMVSAAGPGGAAGGQAAPPAVIRVSGGDLKYSEGERRAVMRGGTAGGVAAEAGTAKVRSDEVELAMLQPGNHAGKDGGAAQVDKMIAKGHVVLTSQGRRGQGEQLVYTAETGEYVLTGTAGTLPRLTDPARGSVTGGSLIFNTRDDSVRVEGGGKKTVTETMAPK